MKWAAIVNTDNSMLKYFNLEKCQWYYCSQDELISMTRVTTEGHAYVCGLCCHQEPCWWEWPVLPPKAMLTSVAYAAIRSCDGVFVQCCGRGLCWCLGSARPLETILRSMAVLMLETMWRSVGHDLFRNFVYFHEPRSCCKGKGSYFCYDTDYCRCIVEKEGHRLL